MKRSAPMKRGKPFERRAPLRATAPAKAEVPLIRTRKCPAKKGGCGQSFRPMRAGQIACGPECAGSVGAWIKASKTKAALAEDRKKTRAALEKLKTLKELRGEAQDALNRFTRARDRAAGYGCICCGQPLEWNSTMPGGSVDAGHFMSRGSSPELALVEANVNAQRKSCNRPGGTTRAAFRAGMVARHGEAVVAALEGPNDPPRYRHDDYRRIRDDYRAKARALEKECAA
jgi:hypothetical protein